MEEYKLELKQIVDYPRCRMCRQFVHGLINNKNLRVGGINSLYYYTVLCCYANFRTSYWDQTDALVRNMLSETQYTKPDVIAKISENAPSDGLFGTKEHGRVRDGKDIIDETVGIFLTLLEPDGGDMANSVMFCCIINCMTGLYYAWEAAVRESGDSAHVNLLFNRASRGLDVYSYLPYEGKVVIRNKGKKEIHVRIPGWADKKSVSLKIDGEEKTYTMAGLYMIIHDLKGTENIEIRFDVPEYDASYTAYARMAGEKKYTIHFRGSNIVDISPRNESPTFYRTAASQLCSADREGIH